MILHCQIVNYLGNSHIQLYAQAECEDLKKIDEIIRKFTLKDYIHASSVKNGYWVNITANEQKYGLVIQQVDQAEEPTIDHPDWDDLICTLFTVLKTLDEKPEIENDNIRFEIKNLKIFDTHDGYAYDLKLYLNSRLCARVQNSGTGSPSNWYWEDSELQEIFLNHVASIKAGNPLMDEDILVDELINKHEENKWLKEKCKKETLFVLKEDKKQEYRTLKDSPYCEQAKQHLQEKYGDRLAEIINERFK